jgi:aminopeptidase N
MHASVVVLALVALAGLTSSVASATPAVPPQRPDADAPATVDHDVVVTLQPSTGTLSIVDRIRLPPSGRRDVVVQLHEGLSPVVEGAVVRGRRSDDGVEVLDIVAASDTFVVRAQGQIVHPPVQVATEHQRSFQETVGTIEPRGVYLSPQSRWLPVIGGNDDGTPLLVTGRVRATIDGAPGWQALSEGSFDAATSTWTQATPVEGLHLVAGRFSTFEQKKRGVDVEIWLRRTDDGSEAPDAAALAERYLEVSGQYLQQYEELIGKYPYGRFTLVENFWDTGYGMPGFTVLGPQVVRLPFILHTSWPHELLHNWWGNGVFPVPGSGNWTEGLTAYLADHLHDEQQGKGADHRRAILQRYQDFVAVDAGLDFPLVGFTNRSSASTEAVGYGKTAMLFHMLRRRVGDDAFKAGLQRLWRDRRFRRASFDDVRDAFAAAAPGARDLAPFFSAWTTQVGAPSLRLAQVAVSSGPDGPGARRRASIVVEQTQAGPPFPVDVPFVVTTVDGRTVASALALRQRRGSATVEVPADVARVDIDPFFDVFRTLSPDEVPPALSRALGARRMLFVTPSRAAADEQDAWRAFATALCPDAERCRVVDDQTVGTLPADAAVWVLGASSLLRGGPYAFSRSYGARFDDHGLFPPGAWDRVRAAKDRLAALRAELVDPARSSVVTVVEHPRDRRGAMAFVTAARPAHIPQLARKLPHYGRYSYLAFSGTQGAPEAAENSLKGGWSSTSSPLSWAQSASSARLPAKEPPALTALPPPLDGEQMHALVRALSSTSLGGRAVGSDGLARARGLVVDALGRAGIKSDVVCDAVDKDICNVVAHLPGTDPSLPRVVLGAHLDHLQGGEGHDRSVYPGADDNASGVAVVVEVARLLAKGGGARGVDVVFFDGEETGRRGSRSFVAAAKPGAFFAMVNLDTVGRLSGRRLLVLDGDSATEWVHAFRGVGFTTGIASELASQGGGASDQQSFLDVGVPSVQLFSGTHADYHRTTDVADRVEPSSLVQAAVVAREIVGWLRDRREPLSWGRAPAAPGAAGTSSAPSPPRRASLGSVPDMTFGGPGVRFDDVVIGSAAATAGLKKGDVLVSFEGADVPDLRAYSEQLKKKAPGDRVTVVVVRDGARVSVDVVLGAR